MSAHTNPVVAKAARNELRGVPGGEDEGLVAEPFQWPSFIEGIRQISSEQKSDAGDPIFLSFLQRFAASIPDSVVNANNPFEPDPLPSAGHTESKKPPWY